MVDARLIFLSLIFFWSLLPTMSSNMVHNVVLHVSYSSFHKCRLFVTALFKKIKAFLVLFKKNINKDLKVQRLKKQVQKQVVRLEDAFL